MNFLIANTKIRTSVTIFKNKSPRDGENQEEAKDSGSNRGGCDSEPNPYSVIGTRARCVVRGFQKSALGTWNSELMGA